MYGRISARGAAARHAGPGWTGHGRCGAVPKILNHPRPDDGGLGPARRYADRIPSRWAGTTTAEHRHGRPRCRTGSRTCGSPPTVVAGRSPNVPSRRRSESWTGGLPRRSRPTTGAHPCRDATPHETSGRHASLGKACPHADALTLRRERSNDQHLPGPQDDSRRHSCCRTTAPRSRGLRPAACHRTVGPGRFRLACTSRSHGTSQTSRPSPESHPSWTACTSRIHGTSRTSHLTPGRLRENARVHGRHRASRRLACVLPSCSHWPGHSSWSPARRLHVRQNPYSSLGPPALRHRDRWTRSRFAAPRRVLRRSQFHLLTRNWFHDQSWIRFHDQRSSPCHVLRKNGRTLRLAGLSQLWAPNGVPSHLRDLPYGPRESRRLVRSHLVCSRRHPAVDLPWQQQTPLGSALLHTQGVFICPATSYSPTQSPVQYHRR